MDCVNFCEWIIHLNASATEYVFLTRLAWLLRGEINGWAVVDPARKFMDSKTRNCTVGTCDFVGNYYQLTEHASCVHPGVRPTDVDLERELEWRRLEEDMVQQDLLSMQLESDDAAEVIVGDVTWIWHLWYSMPDSSSLDESDSDS
ncbi:uncharacterized protein LOC110890804 isoform X1 [Helianthus annuus]|uniref:uncharacterized protein LOC110890804 isoform X1 n=1 Tax=Helianthus annuus TaxID=4232 RepID=UPI000B909F8F|nr:uncharacterized protein LOC110890804 isoform X1 [Helianthus annuus]